MYPSSNHKLRAKLPHEQKGLPAHTPYRARDSNFERVSLSTVRSTAWLRCGRTYSGRLYRSARSSGFCMQYALRTTFCRVGKSLTSGELLVLHAPGKLRDMIKKFGVLGYRTSLGPLPRWPEGGLKLIYVAIDYFTKWIEAKAVATITGNQVKRFVWDNIVCRFGLPGEIVSDNGKQFCDNPFKDWCSRLSITQRFASVKHPQTNGLVERANRSLGEGIKARLDRHKGRWVEELSHVLWAHRTTIKVSTGDTPFSLVYGTEESVLQPILRMQLFVPREVNSQPMTTSDV
ncbi:reverse transcriptase domain-containing protein [Tanacetum coccineum]